MKKALLSILSVLWLTLNYSPCLAAESVGPKLVLQEKSFDFKEVEQGEIIEHTFKVFNEGDRPLVIKNVSPG